MVLDDKDRLSCPDEPAYVEYRAGIPVWEVYMIDGLIHREDGPAETARDADTGSIIREEWLQNDQSHRTDGPAVIVYDARTGMITSTEYWRHGCRMIPPAASINGAEPKATP